MKIEDLSVDEIERGYETDGNGAHRCLVCGASFAPGEVYQVGGRLYEASAAVERHVAEEHGDYLNRLLDDDSKYNALTDNQKRLMRLFSAGVSDKDIASEIGVSTSTIRNQKFMFRERAKQAKFYLAVYERAFGRRGDSPEAIMPIHDHATMVDERYVVTEAERESILRAAFESLSPLRLRVFPPKAKKKVVILTKIAESFEEGRKYSEKEVNAILSDIFDDYVTIRRYLIEYGFMDRTRDNSLYWMR